MINGGNIMIDVKGEKRKKIGVEDMIEMLRKVRGKKIDEDEMMIE